MFRGLFRDIVNQNYGLTLIAHPTQKKRDPDDDSTAYMTLAIGGKAAKIINGLVDITTYLEQEFDDKGNVMTYAYFRTTPRFEAKSRFKYIVPKIVWSYENLAIAIQDAIKKEAESKNLSTSNTFDNSIAEYEITESEFQELVEKTLSIAKELVDNGKQQIVQEQMELILGKRLTETTIHDAKEVTALLATLEAL